ncbi:Myosin head motor domain [Trinorchestia longiramus]|nr:Myosin head motor domain [Trinorchestia longiramus]
MQCLCGDQDDAQDGEEGWVWTRETLRPRTTYWSPNTATNLHRTLQPSSFFNTSFKTRWKELEVGQRSSVPSSLLVNNSSLSHSSACEPSSSLAFSSVPPELYSCFLEATAASSLNQFDASSYSSSTASSGVGSWQETLFRSRSSSSSRGSRSNSVPGRKIPLEENNSSKRRRSPGTPILRRRSPSSSKRRGSPGTPILTRRSPSLSKRLLHSVHPRGKSADPMLGLQTTSFPSTKECSNFSPDGEPSFFNTQRPSRRKKKKKLGKEKICHDIPDSSRTISVPSENKPLHCNAENNTCSVVVNLDSPCSSQHDDSPTARRSRSSFRRSRTLTNDCPDGVVARAKSLGRLAKSGLHAEVKLQQLRPPSRKKHILHQNPLRYGLVATPDGRCPLPSPLLVCITVHVLASAGVQRCGHSEVVRCTGDLNEASLLWNLKIRYDREQIYTYTGSILVSVNPYKMFDIYGLDAVKRYEGQILGTLPPHIFAVASACYARLGKEQRPQCAVISGESGAGKTEATKLIMQYLAAVNKSASNLVTEQILEASPLLESFGNARTVKNDNSSRFGKYLEVFFRG